MYQTHTKVSEKTEMNYVLKLMDNFIQIHIYNSLKTAFHTEMWLKIKV